MFEAIGQNNLLARIFLNCIRLQTMTFIEMKLCYFIRRKICWEYSGNISTLKTVMVCPPSASKGNRGGYFLCRPFPVLYGIEQQEKNQNNGYEGYGLWP